MATENVVKTAENTADIINPQLFNDPIGYFQSNQQFIFDFCTNIIYALAILIIGWLVACVVSSVSLKVLNRSKVEATVAKFISNIFKYAILAFVVTAALGRLGIQTASFVAIIGAASFAIGMSLQGSLANFASGVLLLIFRPIKVGETVEAAGKTGTIEEITIFTTTMLTPDNKVIIVPNSAVGTGTIVNYSRMGKRRVDFSFGIAYGSDIAKAKAALTEMFNNDSRIIKEDGITVVVSELAASSINITCRVWVKGADYWNVYFDNIEQAVSALNNAGINIPFNTVTVVNG